MRQLQLERGWPLGTASAHPGAVYNALASGCFRARVLTRALELLEPDPLLSAGAFRGHFVRLLMEVPASALVEGQEPCAMRYALHAMRGTFA